MIGSSLVLGACGSNDPGKPKADNDPAPKVGEAATCDQNMSEDELLAFKAPKAKKRYKVTLMEVSLAGYYYQANVYGAQQAAKEAGIDLTVDAGKGYASPAIQVNQADSVLARDPDALVLFPADVHGSVPVVAKAKARNVPVVVLGTPLASNDVAASVIQDDYTLGQIGAQQLMKAAPEGGPGILIGGPANATWSLARVQGFKDEMKKHPEYKIVAEPTQPVDPAQGLTDFTAAAQTNPDIKWVYSVFYYQLLPDSLPSKYKGIPFVTTGYEPAAIKSLENGSLTTTASVQNVSIGYMAVARTVAVLNGDNPPKTTCLPAPALTKTDIGSPTADFDLYPEGFTAG
ncbi:MAG: sugar ABC transporter substrate-binding protein [Nocardioidaceae bacterium]|nr:sugar ABC transporter substrate-binding protein [Nocardioidaceae bacterium]